jgi:hypothetical protein
MIEAPGNYRLRLKPIADLLDHRHPVVRVDDLLSHLKSHTVLLKEIEKSLIREQRIIGKRRFKLKLHAGYRVAQLMLFQQVTKCL